MKIFVTGASSFVGCHLAMGLRAAGHDVIAATGPSTERDDIQVERIHRVQACGIPVVGFDMTNAGEVARCAADMQPDVWIQHAGHTRDHASADYNLAKGFRLNVAPLGPIFSAMEGRAVVVTGSVAEYSDSDAAHVETEACDPSMPYGLSKLMETLYARQLGARHRVTTRVARVFLPFGPLDAPEKLLSLVVRALRDGRPVRLSPGLQRRDFLHVDDVVAAYVAMIDALARSPFEIYNVCAGDSPSLREFLLEVAAVLGADPALCQFGALPMRPGEPEIIRGSKEKLHLATGWTPTPWREAVRRLR